MLVTFFIFAVKGSEIDSANLIPELIWMVTLKYFILLLYSGTQDDICKRLYGAGSAPQTIDRSRRFSATRDPL